MINDMQLARCINISANKLKVTQCFFTTNQIIPTIAGNHGFIAMFVVDFCSIHKTKVCAPSEHVEVNGSSRI